MSTETERRQHGTGTIFQPAGRNTWKVQVRTRDGAGKSVRRTWSARTREEAEAILERETSKTPQQHAAELTAPQTVAQLLALYLDAKDPKNPKADREEVVLDHTWRDYESVASLQIVPRIGGTRLDALTVDVCKAFMKRVREEPSKKTGKPLSVLRARTVHRNLSAALTWGVKQGWLPGNPMLLVPVPSEANAQRDDGALVVHPVVEKALTRDQTDALLEWLERTYPDSSIPLRFDIALRLGHRQAETLGLTWERVDLDARRLVIAQQLLYMPYEHGCGERISRNRYPCGKVAGRCPQRVQDSGGYFIRQVTKTNRRRTNVLPADIVERLAALREVQLVENQALTRAQTRERKSALERVVYPVRYADLVFRRAYGKPFDLSQDWETWQKALDAIGVERRTLHAARHTAITHLVGSGAPLLTIQHLVGHSTPAMTSRYTSREQGQEEALAALEQYRQSGRRTAKDSQA